MVAVVLAVLIAAGVVAPSAAPSVIGLLILIVLVNVVTPDTFHTIFSGDRKVSLSLFGAEMTVEAARAADESGAGDEEGEQSPAAGAQVDRLIDMRLKLQARLTYIAERLIPENAPQATAPFVTIGGLRKRRYISDDQARTADRVLTLGEAELNALPAETRDAFLEDAEKIVDNFRATVFRAIVRKALRKEGWKIKPLSRGKGRRPDLRVEKDGACFRLSTVVALNKTSDLVPQHVERLSGTKAGADDEIARRAVVVPTESKLPEDLASDPAIVKLSHLFRILDQR